MRVSISEKIAFLQDPSSYPQQTEKIDTKETHHSWVFLTDQYAYKFKKNIRDERHDYSTLERRRQNCLEELRLNQRLAQGIYLDVVPLVVQADGQLRLNGRGKVVEWLVKMRRIPVGDLLDESIRRNSVDLQEVRQAAEKLARFYRMAPPEKVDEQQHHDHLKHEIEESVSLLSQSQFGLAIARVTEVGSELQQILSRESHLFSIRIREGRIIEGHGDLRPQHVCLRPVPLFIDCLEFSKPLRTLDPVDDLAYLALECDVMGAPEIGECFFASYRSLVGDHFPEKLKYFYKTWRALIRARLSASHLAVPQYREDLQWMSKTLTYLKYAEKNIRYLTPELLL